LDHCNFRSIPKARTHEDEMDAEPWFSVGRNDIFPEEFERFFGMSPDLKQVFLDAHADLLTPEFWRDLQARHRAGEVIEVLPY